MAEKKQTSKWVIGMYVLIPVFALDYVVYGDGWRQWLGGFMLVLSVVWWAKFFSERKKGPST